MKTPSLACESFGGCALALVLSISIVACGGGDDGASGRTGSPSSGGSAASAGSGGSGEESGGAAGSGADGSGGAGAADDGPTPPIPAPVEPCPTLATGIMDFFGTQVEMYVGQRREDVKGPVLFYWHGTGSVSSEVGIFMQAQIDEVVEKGGIVASFSTSTGGGAQTGPFVWYESDYDMADHILACAVEQLNIDTRRIFSAGCSAGGLQSGNMAYWRSSYLAGIMPNSGGVGQPGVLEDPSHVPAVITTHGAEGSDVVVIDFAVQSRVLGGDIASKGGFVVDCNHMGTHCAAPQEVITAQWQFLNDHPYGFEASPYESGLPETFPSYCEIIR